MKFAVIGRGKTGGKLLELIPQKDLVGPFGRSTPPNVQSLNSADVGILFIPGNAFLDLIPMLKECSIPLVIGATGMELPKKLHEELESLDRSWLLASNFSLGIQLFRQMIKTVNRMKKDLPDFTAGLLDIHHIHKIDSPSGTAKSLVNWCDFPVNISARREGDVVGHHSLTLNFAKETVSVGHDAHDRALFAEGALSMAKIWHKRPLGAGLFTIENYFDSLEENHE